MSRLVITNSKDNCSLLHEHNCKSGFKENGCMLSTNLCIYSYSKLNFLSVNFLEKPNGFIACAGTMIYKNKTGKESLGILYEDFYEGSIAQVRKNLCGSYVIAIKQNNNVYVFVDETGTYAFYYHNKDGAFIATNTYYQIQKCIHAKLDELALRERLIEYCNIDNATPFQNIYRLLGHEAIRIDLDNNTIDIVEVEKNDYHFSISTEQSIIYAMTKLIEKYAWQYSLLGKNSILFTTGGVDSRVYLSIQNFLKNKPVIANWQGSPIDMNSKDPDLLIARELADITSLDFMEVDVSHNYEMDLSRLEEKIDKYGEYGLIYCGNSKWYEFFESNRFALYDFGYFGETIKGWELLDEKYHDGFSVDDYLSLYCGRQKYKDESEEKLKVYVKNKILEIIEEYGMKKNSLSREECMTLYFVYRIHADTVCSNFANMFGYSANLFAEKEFVDLINQIPYEVKKDDHLNLVLTGSLDGRLTDVQYFTHCEYRCFDKNKVVLKAKNAKNNCLKEWLKRRRIGKLLVAIKHSLPSITNYFPSEIDKYKRVALRFVKESSFESITGMSVNHNSFSNDIMLLELPGWAKLLYSVEKEK